MSQKYANLYLFILKYIHISVLAHCSEICEQKEGKKMPGRAFECFPVLQLKNKKKLNRNRNEMAARDMKISECYEMKRESTCEHATSLAFKIHSHTDVNRDGTIGIVDEFPRYFFFLTSTQPTILSFVHVAQHFSRK